MNTVEGRRDHGVRAVQAGYANFLTILERDHLLTENALADEVVELGLHVLGTDQVNVTGTGYVLTQVAEGGVSAGASGRLVLFDEPDKHQLIDLGCLERLQRIFDAGGADQVTTDTAADANDDDLLVHALPKFGNDTYVIAVAGHEDEGVNGGLVE